MAADLGCATYRWDFPFQCPAPLTESMKGAGGDGSDKLSFLGSRPIQKIYVKCKFDYSTICIHILYTVYIYTHPYMYMYFYVYILYNLSE